MLSALLLAPLPPSFSRQLLNKTDLLPEEQLEELKEWYQANCKADAVFAISALEVGWVAGSGWLGMAECTGSLLVAGTCPE